MKDFFQNEPVVFRNLTHRHMTFEQMFAHVKTFMTKDPQANYVLMFGTDSQVYQTKTIFITGIVIQRVGHRAWVCIRKIVYPRAIENLHEKISIETSLTEQVASLFDEDKKTELVNIVLPFIYQGATFRVEGHLDIGKEKRNKTREFVNEMVGRIEALGIEAKIKPHSIAASGLANRYTR